MLVLLEYRAQSADVNIHGSFIDIAVLAPDAVKELGTAVYPVRFAQEKIQEFKFLETDVDQFITDAQGMTFRIDIDIAEFDTFPAGT